eukprot:gnl/TRDRNA2_/TRDRNA2_73906_c0_seq1.p1 gnl/TRDRNA2_/TRDRNA2_73906_c0~~gnl/TRDRNA2_/TRDRNA2_73906_c0_seq1.p1  ORF type:complete len:248 (-),score=38.20 gnl/TRDRNA2_/TRDRNA2_73906_c0_seq1:53-691(-)
MEEKISRWVAWVLKSGHKELGVQVSADGWAKLSELSKAAYRDRKGFGDLSENSLRDMLLNESGGRWEVKEDSVRKLDRALRTSRSHRTPGPGKASGSAGEVGHHRRRSRSRSPHGIHKQDTDSMPQSSSRSGRYTDSGSAKQVISSSREVDAACDSVDDDAPDPPPGDHWTKYKDDGSVWWYYEGPKGTWWVPQLGGQVLRYNAEADDDDDD